MAARIYSPPDDVGDPPEIDYSDRDGKTWDEVLAPEREWEERLKQWCRENGQGALAGEEWSYPRGDGYARYVIYTEKPLAMIHVPTGDAWDIDSVIQRGLTLTEVRRHFKQRRVLDEIFGRVPPIQMGDG
jgi:hypothetical protein